MFIELTDNQSKSRVAIKIDTICRMLDAGNKTLIHTADGHDLWVAESYDEIMRAFQKRTALNNLASMMHPNT